ncbi:MAG: hypothetical protein HYT63_01495 [Candidatus Yanofskybacteria bacterium]|nr:hypothetical protein [Candidatus Yanofskybacteria bacterium]
MSMPIKKAVETIDKNKHALVDFRPCTFGDGGFYYHDGADRAICSCGWKSTAVQSDKTALVAIWKIHRELAQDGL